MMAQGCRSWISMFSHFARTMMATNTWLRLQRLTRFLEEEVRSPRFPKHLKYPTRRAGEIFRRRLLIAQAVAPRGISFHQTVNLGYFLFGGAMWRISSACSRYGLNRPWGETSIAVIRAMASRPWPISPIENPAQRPYLQPQQSSYDRLQAP